MAMAACMAVVSALSCDEVRAATWFVVLCCSLAVAAISVAVMFTWMPERCTWPTRTERSSARLQ